MPDSNDWNRQTIEAFRANGGKVGGLWEGRPLLLLTTTGARSGRRRTNPLMYLRDDDRLLVFASGGGANQSRLVPQSARAPRSHRRGGQRDLRHHRYPGDR